MFNYFNEPILMKTFSVEVSLPETNSEIAYNYHQNK